MIWKYLTIEQYSDIIRGNLESLNKLNSELRLTEIELIDQLNNPKIIEFEIGLTTKEYIQLKQLRKIESEDMTEYFKALDLKGIKAIDALSIIASKAKAVQLLDELYIELYTSENSDEPSFSSEFLDRFTWLILISEICKEFNLSITEVYSLPAEDFLQFSLYLKGKREYETQSINKYKSR